MPVSHVHSGARESSPHSEREREREDAGHHCCVIEDKSYDVSSRDIWILTSFHVLALLCDVSFLAFAIRPRQGLIVLVSCWNRFATDQIPQAIFTVGVNVTTGVRVYIYIYLRVNAKYSSFMYYTHFYII